jgi:hypothetical protein
MKTRSNSVEKYVSSYFGIVKNWLADRHPQQCQCVAKNLQNMLSTLDRYCEKRQAQGVAKQAPPCTKTDLKIIISALYTHASAKSDYLDVALVATMWYLYGRGSEAEELEKAQLCVYPGKVLQYLYSLYKANISCVYTRLYNISPLLVCEDCFATGNLSS